MKSIPGVLLLALAEVLVRILARDHLTVLANEVARKLWVEAWATDKSVSRIHLAGFGVVENALRQVPEMLWSQVLHIVTSFIVEVSKPLCNIVLIGSIQIECVDLVLDRSHGVRIKVHHVEAWRLLFESCS